MKRKTTGVTPSRKAKQFGRLVATKRYKLGWTQTTLAKKINVSRTTIANIELGLQRTMLDHAFLLDNKLSLGIFGVRNK